MKVKEFKEKLLERGISFNAVGLQRTIGDVKKLNKEFREQLEKLKE